MTDRPPAVPASPRDRLPAWAAQPWEPGARPWDCATASHADDAEAPLPASAGRSLLAARTPTAHTLLGLDAQRRPRLRGATFTQHHRSAGSRLAG
jgi:hypothetical protein